MSKNLNSQNNEELDLLVLLEYISNKVKSVLNVFKSLFKGIFSLTIYASRAFFENIKLIVSVIIISAIIGFFAQKVKPVTYESSMLVRTYFDAKYQLSSNIKYYNALLQNKEYKTFSSIFQIKEDEAEDIIGIEIKSGPETENDRIVKYDQFLKSIDSTRASNITFEDFVENRNFLAGSLFEITIESRTNAIFKRLEPGLNTSFDNRYSRKKMQDRDSIIVIETRNILNSIQQVDSLRAVYLRVIENESQSPKATLGVGDIPLIQEKSNTREFDLLNKEIALRQQLKDIEESKLQENVFYDIISSFQEIGSPVFKWYDEYIILFPILSFLLLSLIYMIKRYIEYVKNYKG